MEDQKDPPSELAQASGPQGGSFVAAIYDRATSVGRSSGHYNKCFPVNQCVAEEGILSELHGSLSPCPSLTRKVLSEFLGTFVLLFAAAGTAIVNEKTAGSLTILGCAAGAGLAVMIVIFSTGHISGAHINPAVTLAFASLRHFPWIEGGYVEAFFLEFVISAILMFVITAVATDTRAVGELAGIAVGVTVLLNILISGSTTGGSMNPVRTLGPAIAANNYKGIWIYILAPILGMQLGAGAYTLIRLKDVEPARPVRSFRR
ncbi:hypothetical protein O6H91_18G010600 [Diphasiastrum complanatum]|uniref:Uncharacterized protein n=1 Tax=Diphasiastrum complanatum TaxID=34168 RepID=A0ACC2AY90_DIPCM|nr:hypothetical protein O6H91_18G010600 [Diphasiastrum complanatum]